MRLLLIHGKPAVGKLTVARQVAQATGGRLFHNHLTVNLALSLFPFASPAFVALREEVWERSLTLAAAENLPLVIFTFNPEMSVSQAFLDRLLRGLESRGAEVIPVELTAPEELIERWLGSESRRRDGKTMDLETYRRARAEGAFLGPVVRGSRLTIDTGLVPAAEAAHRIVALLG